MACIGGLFVVGITGYSRDKDQSACVAIVDSAHVTVDHTQDHYAAAKELLGNLYPDTNVPGFELARATMAGLIRVTDKVNTQSGDYKKDILPMLLTLESAWPDRASADGLKIDDRLWACRDAVTLDRIQFEFLQYGVGEKTVADAAKVAEEERVLCSIALSAFSSPK